jgi:tRNA A37 N6-isopentenylltransferase MiaA
MARMSTLPQIIVIVGPTGSGKSALAHEIALHYGGELVSADSLQLYRGMDIGTNKDRACPVKQHLIDVLKPGERSDVGMYQRMAYSVIDGLVSQKILPIVVGGTMLYTQSIISGYTFPGSIPRYACLVLGMAHDRDQLRAAQEERVAEWLRLGLLEEIQNLLAGGVSPDWLDRCGLEYRYFTQHVLGVISLEEASRLTIVALGQYIKRQQTWYRHHGPVIWCNNCKEALQEVEIFVNRPSRS